MLTFIGCSKKEEQKSPELVEKGLAPEVTEYILKQVKQNTWALAKNQAESTPYNEMLAESYREQALKHFEQGDPESLQEAVIKLGKSLEYQYNEAVLIELAYLFSCLAHVGKNPELNLLRSEGILNAFSMDPATDGIGYLESRSVHVIILTRRGNYGEAIRLMEELKQFATKQPVEVKRDWLYLEARYLLEKDWVERLALSDELLRINSDNPRYYNYSGLANYYTGKKDVALQCFERAASINRAFLPSIQNVDLMRRGQPPTLYVRAPSGGTLQPEPPEYLYSVLKVLPFTHKEAEGFQLRHSDALHMDTVWLFLSSKPSKAEVYLNSDRRGTTNQVFQATNLPNGTEVKISLRKEGYVDRDLKMIFGKGISWIQGIKLSVLPPEPGEIRVMEKTGTTMVWIHRGCFQMGCGKEDVDCDNDEKPEHQVCLSGFWMGRTEVTQGEWKKMMGENPSYFEKCGDACPVEQMNWFDAVRFCNRLSEKEGLIPAYEIKGKRVTWFREANGYRLPTEAEWEYAARSGTKTPFAFGKCLSKDEANYNGNNPILGCWRGAYREEPISVASLEPNPWGLYDMHGNVWEWCWDRYGDYPSEKATDPAGTTAGVDRVFRGGSWYSPARCCRSAFRDRSTPDYRSSLLGFRLCRSGE